MVVLQPRYNPATIPLLAIIFWAGSYNVLCRPVQYFEPAQKVERRHVTTCYTGTLTRSHGLSLPQSGPLQRLKWPYCPSFVTHSGAILYNYSLSLPTRMLTIMTASPMSISSLPFRSAAEAWNTTLSLFTR